ncbi:Oxidoreductase, FAD-binding protein [Minicystis rosea]|nr:Oxidoreductase, FAD-binding protein [Minicystis rosea]
MSEIISLVQSVLQRIDLKPGSTTITEVVEYSLKYPEEFAEAVFLHFRGGTTQAAVDVDNLRRTLGDGDAGVRRREWVNAVGNQRVCPIELLTPRSRVDLQGIVNRARGAGIHVKAVGSGHSFSDVVQTTGFLVDTTELSRTLPLEPHLLHPTADASTLFRVEGGIKINDLNELLWEEGLALPNMGGYAGQSIAGAISTATHGSGLGLPPLCDMVASIEIVAADGNVYRIEPTAGITNPAAFAAAHPDVALRQDDTWFRAVVAGLGCMGLVYAVTLRVQPRYWLAETRFLSKWSVVRAQLIAGAVLATNRHYEVLVNPYRLNGDHTCLVTVRNPAPEPTLPTFLRPDRQIAPAIISASQLAENVLVWFLGEFPRFTPYLIDKAMETLVDGEGGAPYVDRGYRVLDLGPVNNESVYATEIAFPMTTYLDGVDRILALAAQAQSLGDIYQTSPISLRFVAGSAQFMAMQEGAPRCMIEMPILSGTRGGREILSRYRAAAAPLGGRCHWGEMQEVTSASVTALYPEAPRWSAIRAILDPGRMFDNSFTARTGL